VNNELNRLLEKQGAHIDEFYICPHHPDFTGPYDCRKPGTELLKQAITAYDIDVRKSWFVGDKCSDIQCGQKEGVNTALVLTGYGQSQKERCRPDIICDSLTDFYERIH
jgi:UDP-N-acetylmuramoyl-tripeptide--D-alanyl-D-alanine ligase